MKSILHIDMNSFFASCEQAANPELKGKPIIVGGDPKKRRGIVLAASYDAKAFGVKTTMPVGQAAKLCPEAIFVKPHHTLYSQISKEIMAMFDEYTPLKEQLSIDEAFLDMTGTEGLFGTIDKVAMEIQLRIKRELDIPSSVGISSNKLLAKMASDYKKPMGITEIYPHHVSEKLWPLPVGELYGVGKKGTEKLRALGIKTIGDLANFDQTLLIEIFGQKTANMYHNHANGIDNRLVMPSRRIDTKSISNEITFSKDISKLADIKTEALTLSEMVGWRLRKHQFKGRTISIKIKYSNFTVITRSVTLGEPTDVTDIIFGEAYKLIEKHYNMNKTIRLLGVGVSHLTNETEIKQLSLFDLPGEERNKKLEKLDQAMDSLRQRYGYKTVSRASLLDHKNKIRNKEV